MKSRPKLIFSAKVNRMKPKAMSSFSRLNSYLIINVYIREGTERCRIKVNYVKSNVPTTPFLGFGRYERIFQL